MNDHTYIILWRLNGPWQYGGMATSAENRDFLLKAIRIEGLGHEYAWVSGPITNVSEMEAAEAALGTF